MGIHPDDFLIPVCDQGMNRSQVMRVALTSVVERLGVDELGVMTPWVSRAHGAVSGCDAHTAYEDLDEMNFFGYLFDPGEIFEDSYDADRDDDPQQGPLQRGFRHTFGVKKEKRVGEEMAAKLKLNPTSEYTSDAEFRRIGRDRERTHKWFNKWVFAPIEDILATAEKDFREEDSPAAYEMCTVPPPSTTRRIFFAFASAVPNIIELLLEAHGSHNTVIVSLQYDDTMKHELRHCAGKSAEELQLKMLEVHEQAFKMYASLLHFDPRPGPKPMDPPPREPDPEPELPAAQAAAAGGGGDPRQAGLAQRLRDVGMKEEAEARAAHITGNSYFKMTADSRGKEREDKMRESTAMPFSSELPRLLIRLADRCPVACASIQHR